MKKIPALLILITPMFFRGHSVLAEPAPEDRVVVYDMKEDPTLAPFLGVDEVKGFTILELDENAGRASILYRSGTEVFRAQGDYKLKGGVLTVKIKKNKKTYGRATKTLESGQTVDIIYPVECPPEKGGWRFGPSFGRHVIRAKDDIGLRMAAVQVNLQFNTDRVRCGGPDGECGPEGCSDWTGSPQVAAAKPKPTPPPVQVSLSMALFNADKSEGEIITGYKSEIDSALPAKVVGLSAVTTGYHTTNLPYPKMPNPTLDQQRREIGVIFKNYAAPDNLAPIRVEIQPLQPDVQASTPSKCGAWNPDPFSTPFIERGLPAMYVQTPATGVAPATSSLFVCGQKVVVSITTPSDRPKDFLISIYEALPGQMETLVGSVN